MFTLVPLLVFGAPAFTEPEYWSNGAAVQPRIPFIADANRDKFGDIVVVDPNGGNSFIDTYPTVEGLKTGSGYRAMDGFGQNVSAAVVFDISGDGAADVLGVFGNQELHLATNTGDGHFANDAGYLKLPKPLLLPRMALLKNEKSVLIYSQPRGGGYLLDLKSKQLTLVQIPTGISWIGDEGERLVARKENSVYWMNRTTYQLEGKLGTCSDDRPPAAGTGRVVFGNQAWGPDGIQNLPVDGLPEARVSRAMGDVDGDGDADMLEFRHGKERHSTFQVHLRRANSPGEIDPDRDGLSTPVEEQMKTNPYRTDTDGDGLLDGWEAGSYRGLDFKQLGCDPRHVDLICLISRFDQVVDATAKREIERAAKFYADLETPNPDGTKGFRFHPIWLEPIKGDDAKNAWWTNRDKFRPEKWRGIVHWMQIGPGGGGQADQLGDGGGVGENAMWAVFVHEFGHQMGMDHEGFWPSSFCPIYSSLMNYAYSYGYNDDYNQIHYSDGRLVGYTLRESDLDETIPLPYDKVKFLEKGPYRFRLKPHGNSTLIDWNWNGVFGEKHIRADINYSYASSAGTRQDIGKSQTAPYVLVHQGKAFVLSGQNDITPKADEDPSLSDAKPGRLLLREMVKPKKWSEPKVVQPSGMTGDPVGVSFDGKIWVFFPTLKGVSYRTVMPGDKAPVTAAATEIAHTEGTVPSVGTWHGKLLIFFWDKKTGELQYQFAEPGGKWSERIDLPVKSANPVGFCTDTIRDELVLGLTQTQGKDLTHRWQIRRFTVSGGRLIPTQSSWIGGTSGPRGVGRISLLFDSSRDAGPQGRLYFWCLGLTSSTSCVYVAHQVADPSVGGGWLVKRYYDEWTQSRSAPAVTWFNNDILYAYRWAEGPTSPGDGTLHVAYRGLGIDPGAMGDHNDLAFLRNWGIPNSILTLGRP